MGFRSVHGLPDAAADGDMIILDQDGIIEPETVHRTAAGLDGLEFEGAQARCRLAGVGDAGPSAGNRIDIAFGEGRDAAHPAEKIERDAFRCQQRAGLAIDGGDDVTGSNRIAIAHMAFDHGVGIHLPDRLDGRLQAAQHAGIARLEIEFRLLARRDTGQRGEIAAPALVFGQSAGDGILDDEIGQGRNGHDVSYSAGTV